MGDHPVTLVSFVGTGMFQPSSNGMGRYRETVYRFPDGTISKRVSLFVQALLDDMKGQITKVILIGTNTSSWDALVPEKEGKNTELWVRLNDLCEVGKKGIDTASTKELKTCLETYYGILFDILHHDDNLDESNIASVMQLYSSVITLIPPNSKLLLDITHGFRTMPLLLFQALQTYACEIVPELVTVVYGEYRQGEKESMVREFPELWKLSEIQRSVYTFKNTFDGEKLAESLDALQDESKLGDWVRTFSQLVQMNYVMQIGQSIRQLHNLLGKETENSQYAWRNEVVHYLCGLEKQLQQTRLSDQLLAFGRILFDHGLTMQAVISLRVAVETRVAEVMKQGIGDYALWDKNGDGQGFLYDACQGKGNLWDTLEKLRKDRNLIAHAGGEKYKNPPVVQAIPFDVYVKAVEKLFSLKGML
jgi:CRISPR-associated Csx2 family protein